MTDTTTDKAFRERIRERFPEGLTGIIAVGGTRTGYILQEQRAADNPGKMDAEAYRQYSKEQYFRLIRSFFALGGQNIIVPILAQQMFTDRGPQYAAFAARSTLDLVDEESRAYYHAEEIDPYFIGIDTLIHTAEGTPSHQLGVDLQTFQDNWSYAPQRRKILWEVAPIPLFSIWQLHQDAPSPDVQALAERIQETTDLDAIDDMLYAHYARGLFGCEIPRPHFYIASNRDGDIKLRSRLPIALLSGGPFRMFFVPYPSLFMTHETFKAIVEDVAFGQKPREANSADYAGQYTRDQAQAEYDLYHRLSQDPSTTLGMLGVPDATDD